MKQPKTKKKPKKKTNLIDFQKEKSASDFIKSIENESLYEELRPKKAKLEKTTWRQNDKIIHIGVMTMAEKARLGIYLDEEVKKKAEYLKIETGLTLSEIVELLLEGTSENEILKLAKKREGE